MFRSTRSVVHVRPATPLETYEANLHHGQSHLVVGVVASSPTPTSAGFTVDESGGTTKAIATTGSTKYYESGATSPPTGVTSWRAHCRFSGVGRDDAYRDQVFIFLNELDGTVVSVDPTTMSFVLMDHQGFWRTVNVSGPTSYSPTGTSLGTLTSGQHVAAFGSVDADTVSLDAQFVDVFTYPAHNAVNLKTWNTAASTCPVSLSSGQTPSGNPEITTPPWTPTLARARLDQPRLTRS